MHREVIATEFRAIQSSICQQIEALDGKSRFRDDAWTRAEGGGGLTRVIADGALIEKGGVNFSEVFGPLSSQAAKALKIGATSFYATGVSIVLHAHNPWVPTIHMNIRYFETDNDRWFGGGIDLTPTYVDPEAADHFHRRLKLIEEEFGDGIMSAIDFDMVMERLADPKGDRVKISMSGKFLPFKYYGATGNAQAYGYKEE